MPLIRFPGLIDCHVHLREPGLTQKGDMESETRAALAGGVTTVCDMPNTRPPTVTVEALQDKIERAKRITDVDIRFFFGIVQPEHERELRAAMDDEALRARICGVKVFLDHSTGDQGASAEATETAFETCAELGLTVSCHCEDPGINAAATEQNKRTDIAAHSLVRPPEAEEFAVRTAIDFATRFGTRLHIAHLSTFGALDLVRKAKKDGLAITCEAAPHHLFLTTEDYVTLGVLGKMNPPLRTLEHRDALWGGISDGTVDCIATDHAPHTLEEKNYPEPLKAPSGVPGVETMLPLLLTVAAGGWPHPSSKKPPSVLTYADITRLCFENPNRIFSLHKELNAQLIEVDPEASWTIRGKHLHSKCGWTPYEGWKIQGQIVPIVA